MTRSRSSWTLVAGLLMVSAGTPVNSESPVMMSLKKLLVTTEGMLAIEQRACEGGNRPNCQEAELTSIEINLIKDRVTLLKARSRAETEGIKEAIDEAMEKMDDASDALSELRDRLEE